MSMNQLDLICSDRDVINTGKRIARMSNEAIDRVRAYELMAGELTQIPLETTHVIHAGMYARTVTIPAGVTITGAHVKRSTTLILQGEVLAYIGDETLHLTGYNVIAASPGRKQAFFAKSDVNLTMLFATQATTVEQAEAEFTDETHLLASRNELSINHVIITGE